MAWRRRTGRTRTGSLTATSAVCAPGGAVLACVPSSSNRPKNLEMLRDDANRLPVSPGPGNPAAPAVLGVNGSFLAGMVLDRSHRRGVADPSGLGFDPGLLGGRKNPTGAHLSSILILCDCAPCPSPHKRAKTKFCNSAFPFSHPSPVV